MSVVPIGLAFLDLVAGHEKECEAETASRRETLGLKAPQCLAQLGTVLSLSDRLATCWWGCRGGDHLVERLIGRAVSSVRASLRLMSGGYYDEALSITRGVGEVANLLALFVADPTAFSKWTTADDRERRNNFGPAAVRRRVADLGAPLPVSAERYAVLCEIGTHVTPRTNPQGHNPFGMPVLGGRFQEIGYLLALNELAVPFAFVSVFGAKLLDAPKEVVAEIQVASRAMIEFLGAINLTDGVPRLTSDAIQEIQSMVATLAPEDQAVARGLIMQLGLGSSP